MQGNTSGEYLESLHGSIFLSGKPKLKTIKTRNPHDEASE